VEADLADRSGVGGERFHAPILKGKEHDVKSKRRGTYLYVYPLPKSRQIPLEEKKGERGGYSRDEGGTSKPEARV
jgi:hypothetical protein